MFNAEEFYEQAYKGNKPDKNEVIGYINNFENIVLWGAGNLGSEVGKNLSEAGVKITEYWDINFENLKKCNNIDVKKPFNKKYDIETTIIITCIVNGSLGEDWTKHVAEENGYKNILSGMRLFEGIICPLNIETEFDIKCCTTNKACSLCNCKRYVNLLKNKLMVKDELVFQLVTIIISNRCTLKCIHCGQRLLEYKEENKIDFPLENIKRDIDNFFNSVDFVGMVSIIGGEPFMHNDLSEIVNYCLQKNNFGVINITTNGVCQMTEELLLKLKNDRVKISFSFYEKFLNDNQKKLFYKNLKLVEELGISCSVSSPLWRLPNEIKYMDYTEAELENKKINCEGIKTTCSIKDGLYIPCSVAENMQGLNLYEEDADLLKVEGNDFRDRLKEYRLRKYYMACKYCGHHSKEIAAGEQQI